MAEPREPEAPSTRQTGEMPSQTSRPGPGAGPHAAHDLERIAAAAAGDLGGSDGTVAARQAAECPDCAALLVDLRSIARATRALPPPAGRTRDFRLTPGDAERLDRGRGWRRLLRPFGGPSRTRPIALAFTTLGIAGLLLATIPGLVGVGGVADFAQAPTVGGSAYGAPGSLSGPGSGTNQGGGQGSGHEGALGPSAGAVAVDASSGPKANDQASPRAPSLATPAASGQPVINPAAPSPTGSTVVPVPSASQAPSRSVTGLGGSSPGPPALLFLSGGFLVVGIGLLLIGRGAARAG